MVGSFSLLSGASGQRAGAPEESPSGHSKLGPLHLGLNSFLCRAPKAGETEAGHLPGPPRAPRLGVPPLHQARPGPPHCRCCYFQGGYRHCHNPFRVSRQGSVGRAE